METLELSPGTNIKGIMKGGNITFVICGLRRLRYQKAEKAKEAAEAKEQRAESRSLPVVKNDFHVFCLKHAFFDLSYAVLSQLKPNFDSI